MRQLLYIEKYNQSSCYLYTGDTQQNMQQENYYNVEEGPLGDDDYTWVGGKNVTSGNSCRHAQRPAATPQFPPPPRWTSAPTHQHVAPPKVKLPPFWAKDPLSWFTLVESTFNRHDVVNSWLRFDLVLSALPEEVIEQIRGLLRAAEHLDHS